MEFTYEKYAVPCDFLHDPEEYRHRPDLLFIPDQVVSCLEASVLRSEAYVAAYSHDVESGRIAPFLKDVISETGQTRRHRMVLPDPPFSTEQTLTAARNTLRKIDPEFGDRFDRAVNNGWIEIKPAYAIGLSAGQCAQNFWRKDTDGRPATMEMEFDGTVNDPVYVVHEAGHYLAEDQRNKIEYQHEGSSSENRVTQETQAFFVQLAFYDAELHPERTAVLAQAIANQQRGEILSLTRGSKWAFETLAAAQAVLPDARTTEAGKKLSKPDGTLSIPMATIAGSLSLVAFTGGQK